MQYLITMFKDQLKKIVTETDIRVIGQVLKAKANTDIYNWIVAETAHLSNTAGLRERVFNILNEFPNTICSKGNAKKFIDLNKGYGYCGNAKNCACLAAQTANLAKTNNMENILKKRIETWMAKYGVDNPLKVKAIADAAHATKQTRNYTKIYSILQQKKQDAGFDQVTSRLVEYVKPNFSNLEYHGCFRKNFYEWTCSACGHIFSDHVDYGRIPRCIKCYPNTTSKGEQEIKDFISSLGIKFLENDKKVLNGLELDIVIPELNIAIEYNGIYWHSTKKRNSKYHVGKYLACREKNIHLVQIFEDEWKNKPDIVKSRLRSLLKKSSTVYARKCKITEITAAEYKDFVETHHLQGWASASFLYGLTYGNQLVAVMSFSRSRYHTTGYELIRYCSRGNVAGGASRLFCHFVKTHAPDQVVSYANRCWSNGNLYRTLGFADQTANMENTGYWYIKDGKRYHRSTFTKKRLIGMFGQSGQTESEIMDQQGFLKIYDCGNYKFVWSK